MRFLPLLCLTLPLVPATAQAPLTRTDSALVARVLLAEQMRDTSAAAFGPALQHPDSVVRQLARRASARIADPRFQERTAFTSALPPERWPEPSWKARYRALSATSNCDALASALTDSVWPVRLRAVAVLPATCSATPGVLTRLEGWVLDGLPANASRRARNGVSWHAAAYGLEALARMHPNGALPALRRFEGHPQWQVRRAAARAATTLQLGPQLRQLARDAHPNVQEAAIQGLAKLTAHADDALYLELLGSTHAATVRAAAMALKGSTDTTVAPRALTVFRKWVTLQDASAHDVRVALLEAAGRTAADDQPPARKPDLPAAAVRLALGAPVLLRVEMDKSAGGGGTFTVRLRGDVAPIMAAKILELVQQKYYDRTTWHRVEHDFVIQGGTPGDNEFVGLNSFLIDELGTLPHPRGTIGMSTRGHDTGDAQWFINLKDNARLTGDYTVFGEVIEGIDVVDAVMEGDMIRRIVVVSE